MAARKKPARKARRKVARKRRSAGRKIARKTRVVKRAQVAQLD